MWRKFSWPLLSFCPWVYLEGPKEITKILPDLAFQNLAADFRIQSRNCNHYTVESRSWGSEGLSLQINQAHFYCHQNDLQISVTYNNSIQLIGLKKHASDIYIFPSLNSKIDQTQSTDSCCACVEWSFRGQPTALGLGMGLASVHKEKNWCVMKFYKGSKKHEATEGCRKLHIEDLQNLYSSPCLSGR
jgi:hypothetical protein